MVEATAPEVEANAAAITFRMWHHLPSEAARDLLLAEFALEGRTISLLEAIAVAVRRTMSDAIIPRLLVPAGFDGSVSLYSSMEPALLLALSEALGKMANSGVLNAWRQAFRYLTERLAA